MNAALLGLASACVWFAAFVALHIAGWRAGWNNGRLLVRGYAVTFLGTFVTAAAAAGASMSPGPSVLAAVIAGLTSACLLVLYTPAVYTLLTSLSVQTLVLLLDHHGSMPEAELYERFAGRALLDGRVATLARSGYISRAGSRLSLTPRARAIAGFFAFIKILWKLGAGG